MAAAMAGYLRVQSNPVRVRSRLTRHILTVSTACPISETKIVCAGSLLLQPAGEVPDQPLGLVCVIQFPRLTQRLAHRGV